MGKWSSAYYDGILSAKIKTLVSGAIDRSKFEKSEPRISYETFVQDLDAGDSFTATVIDILVQELAERISRPEPRDKRLIADKTAKSLKLLATPLRVYHGYHSSSRAHRRSVNLTDYLHPPPSAMDLEEDSNDGFEWLEAGSLDGVHSSTTAMYDAVGTPWVNTGAVNGIQSRDSVSRIPADTGGDTTGGGDSGDLGSSSATRLRTGGSWSFHSSPSSYTTSLLRRQPSLRRGLRTRASDFNDFTSRRRSTAREVFHADSDILREDSPSSSSAAIPREHSITDNGVSSSSSLSPDPSSFPTVRRFFSLGGSRLRHTARPSPPPTDWTSVDPEALFPAASPSPPPTHPLTYGGDAWSALSEAGTSAPRLRRGGIRAPESIIPRHASPLVDVVNAGELMTPSDAGAVGEPISAHEAEAIVGGGSAEYPTPTSTDNE